VNQLKATCAVCLNAHILKGQRPKLARHGFSVVTQGYGRGHLGAWHTGPCAGSGFPHLGIALDGTRWALAQVTAQLASTCEALAAHTGQFPPVLHWTPTVYEGFGKRRPGTPQDVKPGELADYKTGRPSYATLWASRKAEMEGRVRMLESSIATYQDVIDGWSPAKYAPVEVEGKQATRHGRALWKNRPGVQVPKCQQFALHAHYGTRTALFADNPEDVNCKRCRKALGLEQAA